MKRIVVGLLAVCLLGSLTVLAEEKATTNKMAKKEVMLQEITASGKLAKHTMGFTLTEADGTMVKIMAPRAMKGEKAPAIDLDKFVGKDVKVVGMGMSMMNKTGKKMTSIKTVTSVEEVEAPAAAKVETPAAPAVAAPAEAPAAPAVEAPAATPVVAPEAK